MTRTEYRRYYYTNQESFEQSLDVYKPLIYCAEEEDLPLVVLVVGSAWLGHRSIIYKGTSWWNSSGPQAFAKEGCVTVCIRHRGSFPRVASVPQASWTLCFVVGVLVATTVAFFPDPLILAAMTVMALVWILLALGARGAANFDEMLHDVADALHWVQRHKDTELLTMNRTSSLFEDEKKDDDNSSMDASSSVVVFGGYSSGGHVAATLLQRPDLFEARGLPPPDKFCDAALFISGVLAVRPTNGSSSCWLTDLVVNVVFGKDGAAQLPSPYHTTHQQPQIPHLLIGCQEEVFGLSWMNVFFCSEQFCVQLQKHNVPARWVEVESDHWRILASPKLSRVLRKELGWIASQLK